MAPATIREIRETLGLSQEEIAHLFGVNTRSWRRWENAEREMSEPVSRLLLLALKSPDVRAELRKLGDHR